MRFFFDYVHFLEVWKDFPVVRTHPPRQHAETDGITPLMRASDNGNEAMITLLIKNGCKRDRVDCDGWNALHWAARSHNMEACRLLLELGVRIFPLLFSPPVWEESEVELSCDIKCASNIHLPCGFSLPLRALVLFFLLFASKFFVSRFCISILILRFL